MNTFHETLINQLSKESSFITDDGELKKFIIIDAAFNMNRKLIELLIGEPEIKEKFFTEIAGHWVFDINLFVQYMENKNFLKDSYTRYRNKIGLNIGGKFLNQRNEVSLVWPFKDCILEGGQSREDQKRPEIFFNEILAQEEIDQLTEPKILTNWKRYTIDGEKEVTEIKRENGIIKENLIIKGNNLLALHSLIPQFEEKIKLIYIDPPYNTGNDEFKYNDNFNHSTWLTFMKNRLEIAKKLLSKNGTIAISIDQNESIYTQTLCDEIFGKINRKNIVTVKRSSVSGAKVINPGVVNVSEFLLIYCKNPNFWKPNKVFRKKERDDRYNSFITNIDSEPSGWQFISVLDAFAKSLNLEKSKIKKQLGSEYDSKLEEFYYSNSNRIFRFAALDDKSVSDEVEKIKYESKDDNSKVFIIERDDKLNYYIFNGQAILFFKDRLVEIDGDIVFAELLTDIWNDVLPNDLHNEGGVSLKKGKKPEKFIQRIIKLTIDENANDIILDYHLGSGTTAAVAHKMKLQYIGIEQLDYGKNDSTTRLKNVIGREIKEEGELFEKVIYDKSGITKSINWQGGGEFVYCELKKYNQTFIEQIEEADSTEKLLSIWEEMKVHSFLNYNVNIKKLDEAIEDFKLLSLETQKQHLCEILNKNQLYVNLSSIDDEDYKVSPEDKKLTTDFYNIKEEQEAIQTKAEL